MIKNIFNNIPAELKEEVIELLAGKDNIRIERIISRGHVTPGNKWYDQDEDEFVLLLRGKAHLLFENDELLEMKAGDYLIIPAHKKHRVVFTSEDIDAVWLTVFF